MIKHSGSLIKATAQGLTLENHLYVYEQVWITTVKLTDAEVSFDLIQFKQNGGEASGTQKIR